MIEIASVVGLATVQDGGRPGRMHQGVPPGGVLAPEMFERANLAAENPPHEAAIEALGTITIVARDRTTLADDGGQARTLAPGETYTLASQRTCVRYLALRGGVDVPVVLGGKGTLLVASLGGHEGRPLRRGDLLRTGDAPRHKAVLPERVDLEASVRIVPGPDVDRFDGHAVDVLVATTFAVDPRMSRVGMRLTGPPLPRSASGGDSASTLSAPMVRGAIQVPPSGELIVLGPDHPTTGGYPVVATITRASWGSLCARPIGAQVRFALARVD